MSNRSARPLPASMDILLVKVGFNKRPPSVNHLWSNKRSGGRFRSPAYRKWKKELSIRPYCVLNESAFPIKHPVAVHYLLRPRDRGGVADLANYEKAMSDALVTSNILADDHLIIDLRMTWAYDDLPHAVVAHIYDGRDD